MGENVEKRRARQARYAATAKGQARNRRYEERHPERRGRLRTGMIARDAARKPTEGPS